MLKRQFNIHVSRCWLLFLTLVHGGAIGVIGLLEWPLGLRVFGMVIVLVSFGVGVWKVVGVHRVVQLQHRDSEWVLYDAKGDSWVSRLRGDSFVSPFLLVLRFNRIGIKRGYSIVLLPDSMDTSDFRQLSVLARFDSQIVPSKKGRFAQNDSTVSF